jgi:hypothetical protein
MSATHTPTPTIYRSPAKALLSLALLCVCTLPAWALNVPFGPQQTITTGADEAVSVFAADVDGDGDLDALSVSYFDDKIAWYENTAGDGSGWTAHTITTGADGAHSVYAADVDGDGDLDALSASELDDTIAWYENTAGDGSAWTEHTISIAADGPHSVYAADVDGDGDLDALSASFFPDMIAWY